MNSLLLDNRDKKQLMELLARRIGEYTPEWRYEPGGDDPGAAITELFMEMFCQTVDRFNQLPQKYYTEFLNLLRVPSPTVTSASGFMQFGIGGSLGAPVAIPQGTAVFAPVDEGDNIVFETERKIEATGAQLTEIYYVDTKGGRIERLNKEGDQPFFAASGGENLQYHRFALSQNEVLSLSGSCAIEVTLHQSARFLEESTARRLADPSFAAWKYWNGREYCPFSKVSAKGGSLLLEKENGDGLKPDEDGRIAVYCDIMPGAEGEISLSGVSLRSSMPGRITADSLANNDVPISQGVGGYCFGRRPAEYELFYIRCDNIFVKRGANINVKLDITPIVHSNISREPQYEFNKRIIDKESAVKVVPEDVFVQQVVWEYYNGSGWATLPASGNLNPFSGKSEGDLLLSFTVPGDIAPALVNAEQGYYIRARVVHVENYLSIIPQWILPFIKSAECGYQYTKSVPADYICAYNNGEKAEIAGAAAVSNLNFTVFSSLTPHPRAMYLCFDASPHAMPLSMLFEICGDSLLDSKILYEAWVKDRFERVRASDNTENLRYTGAVFLYIPRQLSEAEFFGRKGYWLRMSLSSHLTDEGRAPRVAGIRFNIVNAIQRQKAAEQVFNTGPYEAGKSIELLEKPVLDCEVWVDEKNGVSAQELTQLEMNCHNLVQVEREGNECLRCWVKWQRVPAIEQCLADQRVYELDSFTGVISFGKGDYGKVPPRGDLNIRVNYTYGGGATGNLEAGKVNAMVGSIARVNSALNITPMSGGADRPPLAKVEKLGNKRLRHRYVAIGAADFEEITLEMFERAAHVKCFPGLDERGRKAPGHVCLVIMGRELDGERMMVELCREIYSYLATRCDCNLIAGNKLHVVPSTEMTVNVEADVLLSDLDQAAVTQQQISDNISTLINQVWRARDIGDQIDLNEIYQVVKATPNVSGISRILAEGSYLREGRKRLAALDNNAYFPFATVRNGAHTIGIG